MGFEVWIVIVLVASGLSGWIGYAYAKKDAPKQAELDALQTELENARQQADSVQANVGEHFEQSALLFGKLAADYREFLDHFQSSAQNLGLSEARARELIEQGFQPLLTHEEAEASVVAEGAAETEAAAQPAESTEEVAPTESEAIAESEESTGSELQTEPEAVTEAEAPAEPAAPAAEAEKEKTTAAVGEVTVELPDDAESKETDSEAPEDNQRQRA